MVKVRDRYKAAIEYLERYKEATKDVDRAKAEYDEEMEQIDNIRSALGGDGMPRSGEINRKVEADAIRLEDKARELLQVEIAALEIRQDIVRTINKVGGSAADVLMEKYVKLDENGRLKTWRAVAAAVGYSVDNVYTLRRKGLEAVEKILVSKTLQ